jgi:cell division control protein 6
MAFGDTGNIVANDDAFRDDWTPDTLPERSSELAEIELALDPATRGSTPSNMFVYGPTGQGKTVAIRLKLRELKNYLRDREAELHDFYVNCTELSSTYQVAGGILQEVSDDFTKRPRGYGVSNIFQMIFDEIEELGGTVTIVLDEIDSIGDDDTILYKLSRAKSNGDISDARMSVIGISNNFDFYSNLSQRVKNQICEEEVRFSPYDAKQLQKILARRAEIGLQDGVLGEGVIELCAAHAAQDDGSARLAIDVLYKAAKMAHKSKAKTVTESHVQQAREKLDRDMLIEGLKDLTLEEYCVMLSVASLEAQDETPARTKTVYSEYKAISDSIESDPSTLRSVRDHLQALKLYQFLDAQKKVGGGRGGTRWVYELGVGLENLLAVDSDKRFADVLDMIELAATENNITT